VRLGPDVASGPEPSTTSPRSALKDSDRYPRTTPSASPISALIPPHLVSAYKLATNRPTNANGVTFEAKVKESRNWDHESNERQLEERVRWGF
jgi:hypothetical protein